MFGQNFYFSTIRKYVTLFGTLFDDISIIRTNSAGQLVAVIKVPITYGPKEKMMARMQQDPNLDRQTATPTLPYMSFEMTNLRYANERKLPSVGRVVTANNSAKDRKSTRLNSSHTDISRMPSSA